MIVLDTNVISEAIKENGAPAVINWLAHQSADEFWTTSITVAELRYGVALLPVGARRDGLQQAIDATLLTDFQMRVLAFDVFAAEIYAEIVASRNEGRPIGAFDAQIAAIAQVNGAALATRNTKDFIGCGIDVVDPWGG